MSKAALTNGQYEMTSLRGRVRLHVNVEKEDAWIEADTSYSVCEMTEVLAVAKELGVTVIDEDEEAPELTDTGVRLYCRTAA